MTRSVILIASLLWLLALPLYSQSPNPRNSPHEEDNTWLIRFKNGETVTRGEFEFVYQKNNGGWDKARNASQADYREYLDLYVNFKRKVMAAEERGLDTTESFKRELSSYLDQLAQPYLVEKEVLNELVREAYERSKHALRVSHILIKVPKQAKPQDTAEAYQQAMRIRDSILNHGQDFAAMARRHSDDPGGEKHGGYLSWFTAFDFIYPFEDAAYETPVGDLSQPVRSKFGYHIIKVHEKKPIEGKPRLAHILIRSGQAYEAKTDAEAKAKAQELYNKLKNGADFQKLAKQHSNDPKTRKKGGDLGTRYVGIPPLQDKRYELEEGAISKPFKSNYGWHIAKVTEKEPLKRFEDMRRQLRKRVSQDPRSDLAEAQFIEDLKQQYNFWKNEEVVQKIAGSLGRPYLSPRFRMDRVDSTLLPKELISFADSSFTVRAFFEFKQQNRRRYGRNATPRSAFRSDLKQFIKKKLMAYEKTQLARKYPEYRHLKEEYRDGILLFTLTEKKVWKKAVEDTTGLRTYYKEHKQDFPAGERVKVRRLTAKDSSELAKAVAILRKHNNPEHTDSLLSENELRVRTTRDFIPRDSGQVAKRLYAQQEGEFTDIRRTNGAYTAYRVVKFLDQPYQTFEEARPEAITQYQDYLEQQWLDKLAERYPYKLNKKAFKHLYE